jgi:hypothetical protein
MGSPSGRDFQFLPDKRMALKVQMMCRMIVMVVVVVVVVATIGDIHLMCFTKHSAEPGIPKMHSVLIL